MDEPPRQIYTSVKSKRGADLANPRARRVVVSALVLGLLAAVVVAIMSLV